MNIEGMPLQKEEGTVEVNQENKTESKKLEFVQIDGKTLMDVTGLTREEIIEVLREARENA